MNKLHVWLIGSGGIGIEYAKVLNTLQIPYTNIGRGEENARKFEDETGMQCRRGGLAKFLSSNPTMPDAAIVAVNVEQLSEATAALLQYGVSRILVEKPGGALPEEITSLASLANEKQAQVLLAYNRRFYSSVLAAEKVIQEDEGVTSFNFEFTEWSHVIEKLPKSEIALRHWFLANSSHVVDTAFFLGGRPVKLSSYTKGRTAWHPSAAVFAGAGESDRGALFSYHANWQSPGRWGIEILTVKHRLFLRPMEQLHIQKIGSLAVEPYPLDDHLDKIFKPGFYLQTRAFIERDYSRFCSIADQHANISCFYSKISGN